MSFESDGFAPPSFRGDETYEELLEKLVQQQEYIAAVQRDLVLAQQNLEVTWDVITGKPTTFTPAAHNHDTRYYTESEVDTLLALRAALTGATFTKDGYPITLHSETNGANAGIAFSDQTSRAQVGYLDAQHSDGAGEGNFNFNFTSTEARTALHVDGEVILLLRGGTGSSNGSITFATPFPNACISAVACDNDTTEQIVAVTSISSTGIVTYSSDGGICRYIAVGY